MRILLLVLVTMSGIAFAGDLIRIDDSAVKESFCTWHPSDVLCEEEPIDPNEPPVDPNEPVDPPVDACTEDPEADGCPCPDTDGTFYPNCPTDPPVDPGDTAPIEVYISLRSEESVAAYRYKNPPSDPIVTYDPVEDGAMVLLGPRIGLSSGEQLYYTAPRNFGKPEDDIYVEYGYSVKYGTAWADKTRPSGLTNHKMVRLDNNKSSAGESLKPWEERMVETNPFYTSATEGAVGLLGSRFYAYPATGYTDTYILEPTCGENKYQPNNCGDTLYIWADKWYHLRYVWEANPDDDDIWWMSLYASEDDGEEQLVLTRPMDKYGMSARKFRLIEMNSSQSREVEWTEEEGYFPVWFRDFYLKARQ